MPFPDIDGFTFADDQATVAAWLDRVAPARPPAVAAAFAAPDADPEKTYLTTLTNDALAPLVDEGAPGATAAWSWIDTNARQAISLPNAYGPSWSGDPSWDVIPRTDTNKLPPQPLMQ